MDATDVLSQNNMRRLYGFDERDVKAREGFFAKLQADSEFPKAVRKGFDKMMVETFARQSEKSTTHVEEQMTQELNPQGAGALPSRVKV